MHAHMRIRKRERETKIFRDREVGVLTLSQRKPSIN